MRTIIKKTIVSVVVGVFAATTAYAEETQLPHIAVYGTATTEVVPDQMVWSVAVRNKNMVLESAASEHGKTVQTVLSLLKELKVDAKSVQTSRMEFGENREYTSSSWVKSGYYAKTDVSFKVTDLELYKTLWLGLAKISSVSVQNVSYDHTKRIEYRNETRQKALLAAKEKAAVMAKTLGSEIGEPMVVEEDLSVGEGWQGNYAVQAMNNVSSVSGENPDNRDGLSLGTISIKARVKTSFRLLTAQK
jgi:uncharacterized protein